MRIPHVLVFFFFKFMQRRGSTCIGTNPAFEECVGVNFTVLVYVVSLEVAAKVPLNLI